MGYTIWKYLEGDLPNTLPPLGVPCKPVQYEVYIHVQLDKELLASSFGARFTIYADSSHDVIAISLS